jgi:hypothetical protein
MNLFELQEKMNEIAEEFISDMSEVDATELGIDPRASYRFYVSEDGIACDKSREGSVEYYGGFEYERDYKTTIGEYVFWSVESARIRGHLAHLPEFEHLESEEEY